MYLFAAAHHVTGFKFPLHVSSLMGTITVTIMPLLLLASNFYNLAIIVIIMKQLLSLMYYPHVSLESLSFFPNKTCCLPAPLDLCLVKSLWSYSSMSHRVVVVRVTESFSWLCTECTHYECFEPYHPLIIQSVVGQFMKR